MDISYHIIYDIIIQTNIIVYNIDYRRYENYYERILYYAWTYIIIA